MVDDIYIKAGERIRRIRKEQGVSDEKLSETANISRKFLQRIETGKIGFSAETLYKIVDALNADCNYILMGRGNVETQQVIDETIDLLECNYIELRGKITQIRGTLVSRDENSTGE